MKNRYVNTHFWGDNYICNLDPIEKLLFMYFLTNPFTNISGVYEINIRQVPLDTGIDKDMVLKILDRFQRDGKIYYYEGYIIIKNFTKHQAQGSKTVLAGIHNNLQSLPENIKKFISESVEGIDTLSHLTITKPNLIKPNQTKTESVGFSSEEIKDQDPSTLTEPKVRFLKWWKFYNRREGKIELVEEMFNKVIRSDEQYKDFIQATRNYNECSKNYPIDKVKYPINFLSCYKDFIKIDN